jgi:hypothetical protein
MSAMMAARTELERRVGELETDFTRLTDMVERTLDAILERLPVPAAEGEDSPGGDE